MARNFGRKPLYGGIFHSKSFQDYCTSRSWPPSTSTLIISTSTTQLPGISSKERCTPPPGQRAHLKEKKPSLSSMKPAELAIFRFETQFYSKI